MSIGTANKVKLPVISVLLPLGLNLGYEILHGVEEECAKNGFYVTYHNTRYNIGLEKELILKLRDDNICGMIVYPCASDKNMDVFSKMIIDKFPIVLVDRTIDGLDLPYVVSNNFQA